MTHIAGIIPIAGQALPFNMPWHDSLMPINENYHAIERAANTAAIAGCNTIWIVSYRETQPLIRKKLGEWVYDPETIWQGPNVFFNKVEIPVYYVSISARDRQRRDSLAWSVLYGAKVSSYVSMKISKWVKPQKFFVVSPYGVIDDQSVRDAREIIKSNKNIYYTHNNKTFLDNEHLPFTFSNEEYIKCKNKFKEDYSGDDRHKTFSDIFSPISLDSYEKKDVNWFYNISSWERYSQFLGSEHNKLCCRPKYMVTHKWWGFVKDT